MYQSESKLEKINQGDDVEIAHICMMKMKKKNNMKIIYKRNVHSCNRIFDKQTKANIESLNSEQGRNGENFFYKSMELKMLLHFSFFYFIQLFCILYLYARSFNFLNFPFIIIHSILHFLFPSILFLYVCLLPFFFGSPMMET